MAHGQKLVSNNRRNFTGSEEEENLKICFEMFASNRPSALVLPPQLLLSLASDLALWRRTRRLMRQIIQLQSCCHFLVSSGGVSPRKSLASALPLWRHTCPLTQIAEK